MKFAGNMNKGFSLTRAAHCITSHWGHIHSHLEDDLWLFLSIKLYLYWKMLTFHNFQHFSRVLLCKNVNYTLFEIILALSLCSLLSA